MGFDDDDDCENDNVATMRWIPYGVTLLTGIALGFMLRTDKGRT
jgi:hypothetical protein